MNDTVALLLEWIIKGVILVVILLSGFAYTTLLERKVLAWIQFRVGPNRTGPFGLLQPAADGVKLIFKEELVPTFAYKFAFFLAPVLTVVPAFIIMAVIPWGESVEMFGRMIPLGISNIDVGVLYILSIASACHLMV